MSGIHENANHFDEQDTKPCQDWILTLSGKSYARDRSSFKTYRAVDGYVGDKHVIGIGSVELEVNPSIDPKSPERATISLQGVLHIPETQCNVLSACDGNYSVRVSISAAGVTATNTDDGQTVWIGKSFAGLHRLVLADDPKERPQAQIQKDYDRGRRFHFSLFANDDEMEELMEQYEARKDE